MLKRCAVLLVTFLCAPLMVSASDKSVNATLDALHQSASVANADAYFALFSDNAVFIGTDASEVWTIAEFKDYAMPHFNKGTGWAYHPYQRHLYFSEDGNTAWFDELLKNKKLGITRGTGVLVKQEGSWKIAQYHLAIPIPNAIANDVATQIKGLNKKGDN